MRSFIDGKSVRKDTLIKIWINIQENKNKKIMEKKQQQIQRELHLLWMTQNCDLATSFSSIVLKIWFSDTTV